MFVRGATKNRSEINLYYVQSAIYSILYILRISSPCRKVRTALSEYNFTILRDYLHYQSNSKKRISLSLSYMCLVFLSPCFLSPTFLFLVVSALLLFTSSFPHLLSSYLYIFRTFTSFCLSSRLCWVNYYWCSPAQSF
jgi:hypothetical protein